LGAEVGEGVDGADVGLAAQMKPNHFLEHVDAEEVGLIKVAESVVVVTITDVTVAVRDLVMVSTGSRQPSQPGVAHVLVWLASPEVVVTVGAGAALVRGVEIVDGALFLLSLQPNQPGVSQVVVVVVVVSVVVVDVEVVVVVLVVTDVSSKHPHQPGVLQVVVRVLDVAVVLLELVIGLSVWLLSKYCQL
jgi:hypothetical protein